MLTRHLFGSSGHEFKPDPYLVTQFAVPPPWRNPERNTWVETNVCSVAPALHDVIALWKACHTSANLLWRGKYLPTANYSSAEQPQRSSLLGKQKAEMGNKWAVCIWQRLRGATEETSATQSNDLYLWKRSLRSLTDTLLHSACDSWIQTSPLSSAHRLNPQGQQPG